MKRSSLLTNLLLLVSIVTQAQIYEFSVSSSSYNSLSGATSVNNNNTWDDPKFVVPIGFNFRYFDTIVNKLYFGWGLGGDLTFDTAMFGIHPIMFPFGNDLIDRAYDIDTDMPTAGSLSPISYQTIGSPGARLFKLEWKNAGFYNDIEENDSSSDYVNIQLWLYEGSNKIEIHFGPSNISYPDLSYDNETGPYIALFGKYNLFDDDTDEKGYVLTGNPADPTALNTSDTWLNYLDGTVPNGTVYIFRYKLLSINHPPDWINLNIYPVPAQDLIHIDYDESLRIDHLEIINISGVLMLKSEPVRELNIAQLPAGVYFIRIYARQGIITKQLVVD